jgi:hypothetical protein
MSSQHETHLDTTPSISSSTLVILSHPNISQSRLNKYLSQSLQGVPGVTIRHLDAIYPDGVINPVDEQRALESHDHVILQFPLYWYSAPSLLKKYIDEVSYHVLLVLKIPKIVYTYFIYLGTSLRVGLWSRDPESRRCT